MAPTTTSKKAATKKEKIYHPESRKADQLARKAMRGCRQYDSNTLIVGGGFSANSQLRAKLLEFGENYGVDVRIPQIKLCTDNGAMVAMLGVNLVEAGVAPSAPDFPIDSAMPLTKVSM